ncbi:MAG TPA: hypothetical protein VE359_16135 [Vicinamibacteria bacterium]|nr:hypothetical protein [Vicinamibacteria bacterium]
MRILLDHGTPAPLRRALAGHSVATAYEKGWATLTNGALLTAAEDAFAALIAQAIASLGAGELQEWSPPE